MAKRFFKVTCHCGREHVLPGSDPDHILRCECGNGNFAYSIGGVTFHDRGQPVRYDTALATAEFKALRETIERAYPSGPAQEDDHS